MGSGFEVEAAFRVRPDARLEALHPVATRTVHVEQGLSLVPTRKAK